MIRLIACDLDETLLDDEKQISKENKDAIRKARDEYGVLFVPASGRGYLGITAVMKELDVFDKANEYTISNNGGIVIENKDYRPIVFHSFCFDIAERLFQYGIQLGLCIQVFTETQVYAFHLDDEERKWLYMFKPDAVDSKDKSIAFLKEEPIIKILFALPDMGALRAIAHRMDQEGVLQGVSHSFSSNRYLELNPIGVHKGVGLKELAAYLQIDLSETMAIGDNDNDIEMLKTAGLSVAVANANAHIQEIADAVTKQDYKHSAVSEAIHRFVFQEEGA